MLSSSMSVTIDTEKSPESDIIVTYFEKSPVGIETFTVTHVKGYNISYNKVCVCVHVQPKQ